MATDFRGTQGAAVVAARKSPGQHNVTQLAAVAAAAGGAQGAIRLTQHAVVVAAIEPVDHPFRISQAALAALIKKGGTAAGLLITQGALITAVRSVLDVEWVNCVMDIRFPTGVSDGSEMVGRFNTDRQQVRSGYRQSLSYWDEGLARFDVAKGIDKMEQVLELDAFHKVVKGAGTPFLFRNPMDYTSSGFTGQNINSITNLDQTIGVGDAVTTDFQVIKTYVYDDGEHAAASAVKTITRPIASTFVLAVSGVSVSNYTLNTSVGCAHFISRASTKATDISFESSAGRNLILSVSTDFSIFQVGEALQISGSTINATASVSTDHVQTVTSVTSTLVRIAAGASTFTTAAAGGTITVNVHPAPRSGQAITAGYWYDTVAAFQTDEIPMRLSQYHIGEAQVLLEEVRVETSC